MNYFVKFFIYMQISNFFFASYCLFTYLAASGLRCGLRDLLLWPMGLVAPKHLGPSSTVRDQTRIPCTRGWIPNHWTTKKVP